MCGIAGLVHPDARTEGDPTRRMLHRIRHRGTDDTGHWSGDGCALGHARLSIIDLSPTGHQPLANEDGTVWVVLNGEIYNYRELRAELIAKGHEMRGASDAEVIPHLYEEYGDSFVERLRGMFAFALWDVARRRLMLARDRAGKKPLYYAAIPGGLAFASEMKALFAVPGVDVEVEAQAVHDFLSFGSVPGPETVYRGIRKAPPAHTLVYEADGAMTVSRYWSLRFLPKLRIDREEAEREVLRLLRESVRLRLRSDVPVGCFLSGGIDSGLITALAAEELGAPLKTYAIGFEDAEFDERPLAALMSRRFATDHTEFVLHSRLEDDLPRIVAHYDEPFSDPSMVPSFAVARLAGAEIKVVLNGDGADEIFAGYRHIIAARLLGRLGHVGGTIARPLARTLLAMLPAPRQGRTHYQFANRFLRVVAEDDAARYLVLTSDRLYERDKAALYGAVAAADAQPFASSLRHIDRYREQTAPLGPVDAMLFRDFHHLLGDDHLVKMDMATMAHTLEARSPFLDHELIGFAARLPEHLKQSGRTTKPLLRGLADRLLPAEVAQAPKRGFEIPLLRWMKHDLNAMMWERLTDPGSYAFTHFERGPLEALLRGDGWDAKRWAAIAWMLLCLEMWWADYRRKRAEMGERTLQTAI